MPQKVKRSRSPNQQVKNKFSLRHPHPDYNDLCIEISPYLKPDSHARPLSYRPKTEEQQVQDFCDMVNYLHLHNVPLSEIHIRPSRYDCPSSLPAIWVIIRSDRSKLIREQARRKGFHCYIWSNSRAIPPLS